MTPDLDAFPSSPSSPSNATPAETPAPLAGSEESDDTLLKAVMVVLGTAAAGVVAGKILQAGHDPDLEALLVQRRVPPPPSAPAPAAPAAEPDGLLFAPVTERPANVTYEWCYRFYRCTNLWDRKRVVPSAASRSQYDRIAKTIFTTWGIELDARGVSFQRLRWIAAPEDFGEQQDRYLRVLRGEMPEELKKKPKRRPQHRAHLKRRAKASGGGDIALEEEAQDEGPRCPHCGAPRCARTSRRRYTPRPERSCEGEDAPA